MERIRVLVADAQRLFSAALARSLSAWPDLEVIDARPASGPATIHAADEHQPDVAVVDCWMPDLEAAAVVTMLGEHVPDCAVVVTSGFYGAAQIDAVMNAGAAAYVPKTHELDALVEVIRRAHAGERPVDAESLERFVRELDRRTSTSKAVWERLQELTPREVEVLTELNLGRTNDEMAAALGIVSKTIANHVQSILAKTGTHSRSEIVTLARSIGFLSPLPYRWRVLREDEDPGP